MANMYTAGSARLPVTAVHPIIGGSAPAAPPITMFCGDDLFSAIVYTKT